jgi:tetratricopeptide (TPR) repeat protein
MASAVKIFVSATTSDLRSFRNVVKGWLLDMGWLPVVQDNFPPDDKTVVAMLTKLISECDAVIHIVGRCYGAEPASPLKGQPRKSYTQLEAVLAQRLKKRLFIVLLDEGFPYDDHAPEAQELSILQQAYRLQVATGQQIYIPCRAPDELEPAIRKLRVEIDKLNKSRRLIGLLAGLPVVILLPVVVALFYSQQASQSQLAKTMDRLTEIEKKIEIAPSAAAATLASAEARDLLRPGNPDIDKIPEDRLAALLHGIVDDLQRPAANPTDFSGAVKQALAEAQEKVAKLKFADAATVLDMALAQHKADEPRGQAALLAERGRVARLQLRYRDAAGFYQKAAETMSADARVARGYILDAAGALYAQGNEFGDNAALLDAIQVYTHALSTTPRDREPTQWAKIEDSLATALEKLGERENGTARLEAAVASYNQALEIRTRVQYPLDWAATQNNLGYALAKLGEREDGTARLETAVNAFTDALAVRTQETTPDAWATTENNLGNAQLRLGEREIGTARLEAAIEAYTEALKVRTRERAPLQWAATQNNLGYALRTLGERETGTARLAAAAAAFKEALKVRTRERVPLEWAMTENNLGLALQRMGERENGTAQLEAAVTAFTEALKEYAPDRDALAWADTQNNLGLALQALGERESGTERLKAAVAAFGDALKEYSRDSTPLDWAMSQDNLGTALRTLGEREGDTAQLESAVAAYKEALKVYSRDSTPLDWAMTKDNLGNALRALGERESGTAQLEAAIAAYDEALKVRTHEQVPLDWAVTTGDQGIALMLLAKRRGSVDKAREAVEKLEIAYTTAQGGGDTSSAAYFKARLPEARELVDHLIKRH